MATEAEIAYLAGMMDGEGTIDARFRHNGRSVDFAVSVANTDVRVIEWIVARFGGRAIAITRRNPLHKVCWRVMWGRDEAKDLLPLLLPYLIIKRERAELYLALRALMGNGTRLTDELRERRAALVVQMLDLNRRGA